MTCPAERYRIKSKLQERAMVKSYLATDTHRNRPVLLEHINPEMIQGKSLAEKELLCWSLLVDNKVLNRLDHENIVKVLDIITYEGKVGLVIEDHQSRSLHEVLLEDRRYGMAAKLELISQICKGIDYLNKQGVIHGLLDSGNVMITNDWQAKITDFGINLLFGHGVPFQDESYCAPEQLLGSWVPSRTTDVFTVGILAFEIITGIHPFRSETHDETKRRIRRGCFAKLPNLEQYKVYATPWRTTFQKVFAPGPNDRYSSTEVFFEDLLKCINLAQRTRWMHFRDFRSPDTRFEVIDGLESARIDQYELFRKDLEFELIFPLFSGDKEKRCR